jgi:hypothetical protein
LLSSALFDELLALAESMDSSPMSEAMQPNVPPTAAAFPSAPAGARQQQLPTGHALDSIQQRRPSVLTGMDRGLLASLTITSPRGIQNGTGFSMSLPTSSPSSNQLLREACRGLHDTRLQAPNHSGYHRHGSLPFFEATSAVDVQDLNMLRYGTFLCMLQIHTSSPWSSCCV